MTDFTSAFHAAFSMVVTLDAGLMEIVGLSLRVNFIAVGVAVGVGFPVGAAVAILRFPGRRALSVVMNALMGMPPSLIGLVVYLLLSRAGPFGVLGLLFTPTAMIIGGTIVVLATVLVGQRLLRYFGMGSASANLASGQKPGAAA